MSELTPEFAFNVTALNMEAESRIPGLEDFDQDTKEFVAKFRANVALIDILDALNGILDEVRTVQPDPELSVESMRALIDIRSEVTSLRTLVEELKMSQEVICKALQGFRNDILSLKRELSSRLGGILMAASVFTPEEKEEE